jgi:CheY-like chemotaxis protein
MAVDLPTPTPTRLPADEPAARPLRQRPARWVTFGEARQLLEGKTAVVLDPDVEASGRIFVSLGQVGVQVRLARRFNACLQLLDEVEPDLLLAATRLPDGDVLELLGRLERDPTRRPRLVGLSGPTGRLAERRWQAAGCDIFIRKPIDRRLFAQELASHLPPRGSHSPETGSRAGRERKDACGAAELASTPSRQTGVGTPVVRREASREVRNPPRVPRKTIPGSRGG